MPTLIFTVGRMNPPTPGHFDLIEKMIEQAIFRSVKKIYIILSSKTDKQKNPLEPEEKQYILETYGIPRVKSSLIHKFPNNKKKIENLKVHIWLTHEYNKNSPNNVYSTVKQLMKLKKPNDNVLFMTGLKGFPVDPDVEVFECNRLLLTQEIPISGTLVRAVARVSYNIFAKFYEGFCPKKITIVYDAIMELDEPPNEDIENAIEYVNINRIL